MITARALRWVLPMVLGVLVGAVVYGRFIVQARDAVRAARFASANGDSVEATRCYLDALRAYVPGSPFERQALDGLGALAADAARAGDREGERRAFEAIRAGLLATRSIYVPYRSRLLEANQRLSELDGAVPFPPDPAVIRQRGYGLDRRGLPRGPAVAATLVALGGFGIWVGALILLIRRQIEGSRRSLPPSPAFASPRAGMLLAVLFVVGFALFLGGLRST